MRTIRPSLCVGQLLEQIDTRPRMHPVEDGVGHQRTQVAVPGFRFDQRKDQVPAPVRCAVSKLVSTPFGPQPVSSEPKTG